MKDVSTKDVSTKDVSAGETPTPPIPPTSPSVATSAGDALTQTMTACTANDETKLWQIMATAFRSQLSDLASRMASVLSPAEFAKEYKFQEPIETIDGITLLRGVMNSDKEHENPCWKAASWKELGREESPTLLAVLYQLPNGFGRGVLLQKSDTGWELQKITQSLTPEQYKTIVPQYRP